ncbi:coiled-coil domain-containing protein 33-like [Argonauta hians]
MDTVGVSDSTQAGQHTKDLVFNSSEFWSPWFNNASQTENPSDLSEDLSSQQELNRYKQAVRRMGEDILILNDQVAQLQATNAQLKNAVVWADDLPEDFNNIEEMNRNEIMEKYAALKFKMLSQASELKQSKEKILQLQNEIIKDQLNRELISKPADEEKIELYDILKVNEVKIAALEEELIVSREEWDREKAHLMVELNEAKHGFARGVEMTLPLVMDSMERNNQRTNVAASKECDPRPVHCVEPRSCSRTAAKKQHRFGSKR